MSNNEAREKSLSAAVFAIGVKINDLEQRCAEEQLMETMHALNEAKNKLGWEAARKYERMADHE